MTSDELTRNEDFTMDTIRGLRPFGRSVRTSVIIERNWRNGHGLTYDQTFRALKGLVRKGRLVKPTRGWYAENKDAA